VEEEIFEDIVTDMFSYFVIPSTINSFKSKKIPIEKTAFNYFSISNSISRIDLFNEGRKIIQLNGGDNFYCLNIQDNTQDLFDKLEFAESNGSLNYHIYGYNFPKIKNEQISEVFF
jgi:hypothetical protein